MPKYKLTYFDIRGIGEVTRFMFAYAGEPFEDVRIPLGTLSDVQKTELGLPWGQLPVLEIDGVTYGQVAAFSRFIAKQFNIAGETPLEELKCDEIVDVFRDYTQKWCPLFAFLFDPKPDPQKREEAIQTVLADSPFYLTKLDKILQDNPSGWFVGRGLTWADIFVGYCLKNLETICEVSLTKDYPALQNLIEKVHSSPGIKEWVAKRPLTKY